MRWVTKEDGVWILANEDSVKHVHPDSGQTLPQMYPTEYRLISDELADVLKGAHLLLCEVGKDIEQVEAPR